MWSPTRAGHGAQQVLAITAGLLAAALAVTTVVAHQANRTVDIDTWWSGNLAIGLCLTSVGVVLARKVPTNAIGWLFLLGGVMAMFTGATREVAVHRATLGVGPDTIAAWLGWMGTWPWAITLVTLPLILLRFPNGTYLNSRFRRVGQTATVTALVGSATAALSPEPFTDQIPGLSSPIGVEVPGLDALGILATLLIVGTLVLSAASIAVRSRSGTPIERQQIRWVAFSGALLVLELLFEFSPYGGSSVVNWSGPLFTALFVSSIAVAVLRYRLWDIDLIIRLSLVYALLTATLTATYVLLALSAGRVLDRTVTVGPALVATLVVALVFGPLREAIQRVVDRFLYGHRKDPYQVLTRVGRRLDYEGSPDSVLDEVAASLSTSLRFDRVAIVLADGVTVAAAGEARVPAELIPLAFRTETVGWLEVAPRPGAPLKRADRSMLAELARPIAAVVHAVATTEELRRSRHAVVEALEAERRRVRRDLHDGLGPSLAAVAMQLDGARALVRPDPASAEATMTRLGDDIRSTIADVRLLVYDLHPPVLDDVGLIPALAERTAAFSGPTPDGRRLAVELVTPDDPPVLSPGIELAAYRIVCEALNNVVRHARAERCRVTLLHRGGTDLEVLIDDDGSGVSERARAGVGTTSMTQRVAEVGGSCQLGPSPLGGTRVWARFPLSPSTGVEPTDCTERTASSDNGSAPIEVAP